MLSESKGRSRALGEFRGILRAALGIQKPIFGMRNSILGMASHDLSNTKSIILGAIPGAILGIDGHPHERCSFAPAFLELFFTHWGGPRAQEYDCLTLSWAEMLPEGPRIAIGAAIYRSPKPLWARNPQKSQR